MDLTGRKLDDSPAKPIASAGPANPCPISGTNDSGNVRSVRTPGHRQRGRWELEGLNDPSGQDDPAPSALRTHFKMQPRGRGIWTPWRGRGASGFLLSKRCIVLFQSTTTPTHFARRQRFDLMQSQRCAVQPRQVSKSRSWPAVVRAGIMASTLLLWPS